MTYKKIDIFYHKKRIYASCYKKRHYILYIHVYNNDAFMHLLDVAFIYVYIFDDAFMHVVDAAVMRILDAVCMHMFHVVFLHIFDAAIMH